MMKKVQSVDVRRPAKQAEPFGFALIFSLPFFFQEKKGENLHLHEGLKKFTSVQLDAASSAA